MANHEPETIAFCNTFKMVLTASNQSSRGIAKELGVSHATLSRIASGKQCDLDNYFKIKRWLAKQGDALEQLKSLVTMAQDTLTKESMQ